MNNRGNRGARVVRLLLRSHADASLQNKVDDLEDQLRVRDFLIEKLRTELRHSRKEVART